MLDMCFPSSGWTAVKAQRMVLEVALVTVAVLGRRRVSAGANWRKRGCAWGGAGSGDRIGDGWPMTAVIRPDGIIRA